ncbi:hypothetical protein EW146_g2099 [Bondarzewia mesenterica]|uniref:Succinate dehydrogenase cytochrome b560 subunit n=1 Tax=Bondarzewia mesenterica TaxID=1095465 RepID=A0A4V3XFV5_9AGAM|nr:hypothetical protein EW146_g2099 [Bondarzewia mesenterica]
MNCTRIGLGSALRRAAFSSPKLARNPATFRLVPKRPHFTIYQPQLTWIGSIFNRATGTFLSVLLYGFSLAYLVAPSTFSSANVVDTVKALPQSVKIAGKTVLALPFAFHGFNGLRHLAWDSGKLLSLKGAYASGYAVLGATAIGTVVLVLL